MKKNMELILNAQLVQFGEAHGVNRACVRLLFVHRSIYCFSLTSAIVVSLYCCTENQYKMLHLLVIYISDV